MYHTSLPKYLRIVCFSIASNCCTCSSLASRSLNMPSSSPYRAWKTQKRKPIMDNSIRLITKWTTKAYLVEVTRWIVDERVQQLHNALGTKLIMHLLLTTTTLRGGGGGGGCCKSRLQLQPKRETWQLAKRKTHTQSAQSSTLPSRNTPLDIH